MVVHVAVVLVGNMPPQSLLVVDLNAAQARATSREDAAVGNRTAEERVDLMVAFYDYLFCGNRESSQSNRMNRRIINNRAGKDFFALAPLK